jgi:L-ascorbate metabolism protein UlaG (beta-lactamase superfamily)
VDYWTILELVDSDKVNFWVVPLGIKEWLINKAGVCPDKVVELEWWEGVRFSKEPFSNVGVPPLPPKMEGLVHAFDTTSGKSLKNNQPEQTDRNELVITCAPAQHWCSRTPFDRNRRLWCSYAVHATLSSVVNPGSTPQTHSFYFAGDTGLPPEFPLHYQIGDRLGPFDLAAIPIGAYEPRWFMKESHCDPAGAVVIHQAIRAQKSVAIHFDTFNLADEPQAEPPQLLVEEVLRVNEEIGRLADEVVAVAGEVNIVVGQETSVAISTTDDQIMKNADELVEQTKTVNDILPSLVDFAVIKQGHFIESSPK